MCPGQESSGPQFPTLPTGCLGRLAELKPVPSEQTPPPLPQGVPTRHPPGTEVGLVQVALHLQLGQALLLQRFVPQLLLQLGLQQSLLLQGCLGPALRQLQARAQPQARFLDGA